MVISISFLSPDFVLNRFHPKYNYQKLETIDKININPNKEVQLKVTRYTPYGERYRLFVIPKNTFDSDYNLQEYGITIDPSGGDQKVYKTSWKGLAKKHGLLNGDVITEFKIENLERPNKAIIYPFSLAIFCIFGYINYRRKNAI